MEMIDVCIVTRDGNMPKGLEHIPINKVLVNRVSPVGTARRLCIKEVSTPIFAFIDDDVIIDEYWFDILYSAIKKEDVGAVWGTTTGKGYGFFSKYSYDAIGLTELKKGDRFNTNNCLIKTDLVRDWIPTCGLNCYEDLDIGNYIMSQGFKVLFVPSTAIHYKGWRGLKRSALWAGYYWVDSYKRNHLMDYVKRVVAPFKIIILRGLPSSIYIIYRNFWFCIGMLKRDLGLK